MGNLEMFYPGPAGAGTTPAEREARLDRFLAATLAFGNTGFLVLEGGMSNAARSYFLVQQVHARYAQAQAAEIRYADQQGRLLDTSAAVAGGEFRRSQVVTRYDNGLEVRVNGHPTETWQTPLLGRLSTAPLAMLSGAVGQKLGWITLRVPPVTVVGPV